MRIQDGGSSSSAHNSSSTTASSSMSTQSGSPPHQTGGRNRHRSNSSGALAVADSARTGGKLPGRGVGVRMGGKRLTQTSGTPTRSGGGGGPRASAECKDGRPILGLGGDVMAVPAAAAGGGGGGDDDRGAVDADALNAALLAVQADATVSRAALHRMLSARQRRPLREDSAPPSREGEGDGDGSKAHNALVDSRMAKVLVDSSSGRSLKGATPIVPKPGERHRRCMTMDDRWVS